MCILSKAEAIIIIVSALENSKNKEKLFSEVLRNANSFRAKSLND